MLTGILNRSEVNRHSGSGHQLPICERSSSRASSIEADVQMRCGCLLPRNPLSTDSISSLLGRGWSCILVFLFLHSEFCSKDCRILSLSSSTTLFTACMNQAHLLVFPATDSILVKISGVQSQNSLYMWSSFSPKHNSCTLFFPSF